MNALQVIDRYRKEVIKVSTWNNEIKVQYLYDFTIVVKYLDPHCRLRKHVFQKRACLLLWSSITSIYFTIRIADITPKPNTRHPCYCDIVPMIKQDNVKYILPVIWQIVSNKRNYAFLLINIDIVYTVTLPTLPTLIKAMFSLIAMYSVTRPLCLVESHTLDAA